MVMLFCAPVLAGPPRVKRLVRALHSSSYKVRMKAAILLGEHKLTGATRALMKVANKQAEKPVVRAAALVALGQIGKQESRKVCAYLIAHKDHLIANAAIKALVSLDHALPSRPFYLVSIEHPKVPAKNRLLATVLERALEKRVRSTSGLVLSAGEEKFLGDEEMRSHLKTRDLTGLLLRPELLSVTSRVEDGKTIVEAQVRVTQFTMPGRVKEFFADGGANSWIEDTRIAKSELQDLQTEVVKGAADSALMQVLEDLQDRAQ